jgi:hypothetical protein
MDVFLSFTDLGLPFAGYVELNSLFLAFSIRKLAKLSSFTNV